MGLVGGGSFVVGRAGPVAGAADAFKPNHKALQIGGKGSLNPQQQQLDAGRRPRRSGAFGVVVGAHGLLASRRERREKKSTEAAQRRWSSVVEEGQAIGAPGLQLSLIHI